MNYDGIDLLVTISFFGFLLGVIIHLKKSYNQHNRLNKILDKYNRIDKQFAAKEYYNDSELYGDNLHMIKRGK